MRHFLLFLLLSLGLASCATTPTSPPKQAAQRAPVSLENMDTQFLYLAAQRALSQEQLLLASRFLQALVKKDPSATLPRLELVELLLSTRRKPQIQQAQRLLQAMSPEAITQLSATEKTDFQLLYARTLLLNQDVEEAITLLNASLLAQPNNLHIRQLLIRANIQNSNLEQAHQLIRQGLKLEKSLRLQRMQVQLYIQQQRYKKADRALRAMQKTYPAHEDIALQRSLLAEEQKQDKKAERLLKNFIKQHPQIANQSYRSLAELYVRQQRLDAAIDIYQKLLPRTADVASVHMALGKIYYEQSQYIQAAQAFEQAVFHLASPNDSSIEEPLASAYFYWAASLEANHQWEDAIPHYQSLQTQHRFYVDAQLRLSSIDLSQKHLTEAEKRLQRLIKLFPQELDVYEMLSNLHVMQKAYQKLLTTSEQGLNIGFSSALLFNRAIALDALKRFEALDETLNMLLKKEPKHSEALNFYAYSLAERGERLDAAQTMIQYAVTLKPNDGYYLDSLAWVYFKQQQYEQAVNTQLRAVAIIDDDPTMQDHLGDMLWHQGEAEQARDAWQKAIQLKHEFSNRISLKIKHGLL